MKIAILMNETGTTVSFSEKAELFVYERVGDTWVSELKHEWTPGVHHTLSALRDCLRGIVDWLKDCKVVAARRSNGFYRVVFEGYGVSMWAIEGYPQDFIPQIERFYQNNNAEKSNEPDELISPIAGKPGFYSVDLREVMAHHGSYNSRDILMPFFEKVAFERLEIICDHVPRWFEKELPAFRLRADAEAQGNIMKVHVYSV